MNRHLCYSGDANCSGCRPCQACTQFLRTRVVPKMIIHVGIPFSTDRQIATRLILAFDRALEESVQQVLAEASAMAPAPSAAPEGGPVGQGPGPVAGITGTLSPVEELVAFRLHVEQGRRHLTDAQVEAIGHQIKSGQLQGWNELSVEQREIMREVFLTGYTSQVLGEVKRAEEQMILAATVAAKQAQAQVEGEKHPPQVLGNVMTVPSDGEVQAIAGQGGGLDDVPGEDSAMAVAEALKKGTLGQMSQGILSEITGQAPTAGAGSKVEGGPQPTADGSSAGGNGNGQAVTAG